jgi:hypothetical protein
MIASTSINIRVKLSAAITTQNSPITGHFITMTQAGFVSAVTPIHTVTQGVTPVAVAPVTYDIANINVLKNLQVTNADTAPITVILEQYDGTTARTMSTTLLPIGASLTVNADGSIAVFPVVGGSGSGTVTSVAGTGTVNGITLTGTVTSAGNLTLGGAISGNIAPSQVTIGATTFTPSNYLISGQSSVNSYNQLVLQNSNSGATASCDIAVNNNNGTDTTYYGNFGINSSGYTGSGAFNAPNAVYMTSTTGDLAIGTTTSNAIHFVVNNGATDAMTISSAGAVSLGTPLAVASGGTGSNIGTMGFKNLLINAGFVINNGNAGTPYVSAAALAAGATGHECWKAGSGGGDYSFTQLKSNTQITIASSKTLIQVIEDVNVQGTAYVLSWTGTAQARYAVNSAIPAGSYAASPILITGQTVGTTMSVEFNTGTLKNPQLEQGAIVTNFDYRDFNRELLNTQRYFFFHNKTTVLYGTVLASAALLYCAPVSFPVQMRATPTVTTNISSANGYASAYGPLNASPTGFDYYMQTTTTGNYATATWSSAIANARL